MRTSPLPGFIKKGCNCKGGCNCSTQGYKRNSPDVNNDVNIIPSGDITMKGVDFKVKGEDNLGNVKIMKPGKDYKFPGTIVKETKYKK
tara:strand:+ start:62 stop:325 length:264 start_codon:yes stop_codon:yes gene_type:complete